MSDTISLQLESDEALVFFDWLVRYNNDDKTLEPDPAELRVLFDLEAKLESILTEPFDKDYKELLEKARSNLRQ